jgi:hypothetical protein
MVGVIIGIVISALMHMASLSDDLEDHGRR